MLLNFYQLKYEYGQDDIVYTNKAVIYWKLYE